MMAEFGDVVSSFVREDAHSGTRNAPAAASAGDAASTSWTKLRQEIAQGRLDHETFGDFTLSDIAYQTQQEADAARVAHLGYQQISSVHDPTMPRNDEDRRVIIVKLVRALVAKQGAQDGVKKLRVWENNFIVRSKYSGPSLMDEGKKLVERAAWLVLHKIESYHRDQLYPPRVTPRQGSGAFLQHVEDVCEALYAKKTIADRIIHGLGLDPVESFVSNVKEIVDKVEHQKVQNDTRAEKLKALKTATETERITPGPGHDVVEGSDVWAAPAQAPVLDWNPDPQRRCNLTTVPQHPAGDPATRNTTFINNNISHFSQASPEPSQSPPEFGVKRKPTPSDTDMDQKGESASPAMKKPRQVQPSKPFAASSRSREFFEWQSVNLSNIDPIDYVPAGVEDIFQRTPSGRGRISDLNAAKYRTVQGSGRPISIIDLTEEDGPSDTGLKIEDTDE